MTERKLLFMAFLLLILPGLTGCLSTSIPETRTGILPDLEYPVYRKRTIEDRAGNLVQLTLLGLNKRSTVEMDDNYRTNTIPLVDVYVLWEMKRKVSRQYSMSFTCSGGDSDYYIRTAAGEIHPIRAIARGPVFPATWPLHPNQGGLLVFSFPGYDPDKDPVFNMIEGGRSSIHDAAYNTKIKDPSRWNFLGCRAVRRTP